MDGYGVNRYEHFFHFALAHLLLYGLVKDFLNIWARPPDSHRKSSKSSSRSHRKPRLAGNIYIWPRLVKKQIALRATQVKWTSQLKKRSADVFGYVLADLMIVIFNLCLVNVHVMAICQSISAEHEARGPWRSS